MVFLRNWLSLLLRSFFFSFFIMASAQATMFIPVSLSKQVEGADAVAQGEFVSKSSKKSDNRIVTEFKFRVHRYAVKDKSTQLFKDAEAQDMISFFQPGGVVGDEGMAIAGTAEFRPKETTIVLLKKSATGDFWLASLALGKYDHIEKAGKSLWSSNIFPHHPQLGQLSDDDFKQALIKNFHSSWQSVFPEIEVKSVDKNKVVYEHKNKAQRKIASEKSKSFNFTWMIAAMSVLFILGMWLAKEKQVNE